MKTNWSCAPILGALFAAGATFASQPAAQAQSCANDADCGAGYQCETRTYESCWGGWDCGDDDGGCTMQPGECETIEESYCTNAPCAADAECPDSMACHAQTVWVCEGGGTAGTGAGGAAGMVLPGDEDGGGYYEQCYETPGASICIPRYQLPCEAASDCGGGFDCVENYYWECGGGGGSGGSAGTSGSGGMAAGGAGGAPSDEDAGSDDYSCHQIPSGSSSCELQDLPCDADADCPAGLECATQYYYPPCEGMGGAGGAPSDDDGGRDYYECQAEQRLRCMPPSYEGGGGSGGAGGASGAGGMSGSSGGSSGGDQDAGSEVGGMGGAGGGAGTGAAGTGAAGMSGEPDDDGDSDEDEGNGKHKKLKHVLKKLFSGCSTTGPTSSEGGLGWLVLGMTALVLRRRTRKA